MHPDLARMIERVHALHEQARDRAGVDRALLEKIEDVLTEGYARALEGDAWSMRSEQRLHELIDGDGDGDSLVRSRELRTLATEHARFQNEVMALRRELAELRHERDRLHAGSHVT
jgi:uncharacterized protein YceH (UPF0502 family)